VYSTPVYLDNISTTRIDPAVYQTMIPYFDEIYGNASSIHKPGTKSSLGIEKSRLIIASKINALPEEIYFTSGGTESNNWALKGAFYASKFEKIHIIVSSIEHPSIYETATWLENHNAEITYLPVDNKGLVNIDDLRKTIRKNTILVSIIHASNEVGTIEPIEEIGNICKEKNIYFHTDACQSFTKVQIDVEKQGIDMATFNAHKCHGPKGIGALFIRKGTLIDPFLHGGSQERGMRSGTYATSLIAGFGKAVEIANENDILQMKNLRDYFIDLILRTVGNAHLNGCEGDDRICNNINIGFGGISGKQLFSELNKKNVFISAGSACSSTKLTPSMVLKSMSQSDEVADSAVRIGLSKWTTSEELDLAAYHIKEIVKDLRKKNG
jgi:cysteine desulfurase